MEGNLRQESPPTLPDLACPNSLTRSSSEEEESALTVDDLKDTFRQTQDKWTTWTDEKHSLYLGHLESSFVEQLHRSMGLSQWCSLHETESANVSERLSAYGQNTYGQLTVLEDGSLKKIELKRYRPTKNAAEPLVLRNSWMHRLRRADKNHIVTAAHAQECNPVPNEGNCSGGKSIFTNDSATSSHPIPVSFCSWDGSVDCTEEFSDQNFPHDVVDGKSRKHMPKRSKTSVDDTLSADQMVPVGKSYMADTSAPSHTCSKRKEKPCQECLPESEYDRITFLGGS